jgi:nucleoside-diphosphate-sugar epimerase
MNTLSSEKMDQSTTTKTLIFGARSNLSRQLRKNINNSELISSDVTLNNKNYLKRFESIENLNIIINSFYPASKLNDFFEPALYIQSSVLTLANILNQIKDFQLNIGKILYTSSASVYGINKLCLEDDILMPLNLHSSLKVSSEKLIEGFCNEMNIDYIVARVFNMYGGDDKFSIISKVIDSYLLSNTLHLANHGASVRDYIHINDVVMCYKSMLKSDVHGVVNVASGNGESVKNILEFLKLGGIHKFNIENYETLEIDRSVANIDKLRRVLDCNDFVDIIDYIALKTGR